MKHVTTKHGLVIAPTKAEQQRKRTKPKPGAFSSTKGKRYIPPYDLQAK